MKLIRKGNVSILVTDNHTYRLVTSDKTKLVVVYLDKSSISIGRYKDEVSALKGIKKFEDSESNK